jgi:hypothetical protein
MVLLFLSGCATVTWLYAVSYVPHLFSTYEKWFLLNTKCSFAIFLQIVHDTFNEISVKNILH